MLGMLHKTNTITGASHLGAKPFITSQGMAFLSLAGRGAATKMLTSQALYRGIEGCALTV